MRDKMKIKETKYTEAEDMGGAGVQLYGFLIDCCPAEGVERETYL
jgi:hypothetical protein